MIKTAIAIKNLDIGYKTGKDAARVHSGIHLNVLEGEVITLIGANGIGKSTLLKTLTRFLPPISGEVVLFGKNINNYNRTEFAKTMSFVSTDIVSVNNLRAKEMVALGRHPYTNWLGSITESDHAAVQKSLSDVSAKHLAEKFVNELSDGERQRIMIARALAQNTGVIILDEPTAFLDLPNKYEIFHLLVRLSRKDNKTIILSSHDLNIALTEVDKVWLMNRNEIIEGAPEDLILQNHLSGFLKGTNVTFDSNEGSFKLHRKIHSKIQVSGEGLTSLWTMKALERQGFQMDSNAAYEVICTMKNGFHWVLKDKELRKSFDFDNIYDLNLHLKLNLQNHDNHT